LIELLIYVSLLGALLLGASAFFAVVSDSRIKNQTIAEVDQQGTAVMENIAQTIRGATGIVAPSAGSSAASLTINVPTPSLSPTLYNLSSGNIYVKEATATPVALSGGKIQVTNLTFTNLSRPGTHGVIRVSMTLSRINPSGKNEYDFQKTFTSSVALR
jgi:Tfp pilus assembly protein PilW